MSFKGKTIRWFMEYAPSGARKYAITKIMGDYGKMLEFKFNPHKKYIHATIKLAGEETPIDIEVEDYELVEGAGKGAIVIKHATANREWINVLIRDMLIGRELPVPADKYKMVKEILAE